MPRIARVVVPNMPHHVTQRGNRRQEVFFCEDDYRAYLSLMKDWCGRHGVRVWSYCLMPNHVHLIVVPPSEEALCRSIGEAHRRYTRRVNFREGWRGHLWQGRFASFVMDEPYLLAAARYVERNPVKARLVRQAAEWAWSSAAAHVDGRRKDALAEWAWLRERTAGWICSWRDYLAENDDKEFSKSLRQHENTGRPLGEHPFVQHVGHLLGRNLIPQKPGPKRKAEDN
jgi:putative transposase